MLQRLAILLASLAAALTLAVGLAVAGFVPHGDAAPQPAATGTVTPADAPGPTVQVDTVYVAPPAKPADITVHKVVNTAGGEGDEGSEHEGGDD